MAPLDLYDITVPIFLRTFAALSVLLDKATAHAKTSNASPDDYVNARLAPDMKPLSFQIQTCSNTAKGTLTRVAGMEAVPMEDNETTMEALKERVKKTVAMLEKAKREDFKGKEDTEVRFKPGPTEYVFTGKSYVTDFTLPNFYFHAMTTVSPLCERCYRAES